MTHLSPAVCRNTLRLLHQSSSPLHGITITSGFRNRRRFHACPRCHSGEQRYPHINTNSLADTLEDHRATNRLQPQLIKYSVGDKNKNDGAETAEESSQSQSQSQPQETDGSKNSPDDGSSGNGQKIGETNEQRRPILTLKRARSRQRKRRVTLNAKGLSFMVDRAKGQRPQHPWMDYMDAPQATRGISRLNQELDAYERYMSEIPHEIRAAQMAQQEATQILKDAGIPEPVLFGSRRTGMALRHSDMELLVPVEFDEHSGPGNREQIHEQQRNQLASVAQAFKASNAISSTSTNMQSRIPYVRGSHTASGLTICVNCGAQLISSSEHVLHYARKFPALRTIFTVIRMALDTRDLFGSGKKGPTPYTLIMLIVAALKMDPAAHDPENNNPGQQLLHVLRFYADFDFAKNGISVDPPGIFPKVVPAKKTDPCPSDVVRGQMSMGKYSARMTQRSLCLQDPTDPMNDVGIMCLSMRRLKIAFDRLHTDLQECILAWDGEDGKEASSKTADLIRKHGQKSKIPFLYRAVAADYESLERLRDNVIIQSRN